VSVFPPQAVPGIRGTELSCELLRALPNAVAPAPWELAADAVVWLGRPSAAAISARQPGVVGRVVAVGGMFVSYSHTPVGPYDEIIGFLVLASRRGVRAHIPFIAVDSLASLLGGRANWSLPKTLASFSGSPGGRRMSARHRDWEVSAQAFSLGPALPARVRFSLRQAGPDRRAWDSPGRARVSVRAALVRTSVRGIPELCGWLSSGMHPGLVVERFEGSLGPAAPLN
jgi:hypothetical protein